MAITTNLPPQAYTRDTLVKAIEWLATQPQAVRERATSADLIVSYYLQARRRMTAAQMEAPVSGENFKADLKHLAEDLKQFEDPSAPPTAANRALSHGQIEFPEVQHLHPAHMPMNQAHTAPHVSPAPVAELRPVHAVQAPPPPPPVQHHYVPPAPVHPAPPVTPQAPKAGTWTIDPRSQQAAKEIQQRFNLSSEGEAIRFLITLGLDKAREMFS